MRTFLTIALSTLIWFATLAMTLGKSSTSLRGTSSASETRAGSTAPFPLSVMMVAAAVRLVRMRSIVVAISPPRGAGAGAKAGGAAGGFGANRGEGSAEESAGAGDGVEVNSTRIVLRALL